MIAGTMVGPERRAEPVEAGRDLATVIAIAVVAFAISSPLHEALGHGGACLLTGGHALLLTSASFDCSRDNRLVAAAGTLVNLVTGLVCWLVLKKFAHGSGSVRYFLWLLMTINLLMGTGYFFYSGVSNIGDWAEVVRGVQPQWLLRLALTVVGIASYLLVVWFALRQLRGFLAQNDWRRGGAKDLTIVPYLTGGVLFTIAGMFNPGGLAIVATSAAAASFGGNSGLAWMTQYLGGRFAPKIASEPFVIPRSWAWIAAAVVAAGIVIGVLGRGVTFS